MEVVLGEYSASNPPPGIGVPILGVLASFNACGVVLKRGRGGELFFFPFASIRAIRLVRRAEPAAA